MSEKKDIGTALRSKMDGYTTKPRVNLWPGIEAKLKRKKKRGFLRIILIGFISAFIAIFLIYELGYNSSSTDPIDSEINSLTDDQTENEKSKDSIDSSTNKEPKSSDYNRNDTSNDHSRELPKLTLEGSSSTKNTQEEDTDSKSSKKNRGDKRNADRSDLKQNDLNSKGGKNDLSIDLSVTGKSSKDKTPNESNLLPVDLKRLGELKLKLDSIQLYKGKNLQDSLSSEEEEKEFNWSLFPYVSLDHYNAFGRTTTEQNSFNYGIYLSYYSTKRLLLRSGFKPLNLQYNFQNNERQQQVKYSEIPMEARYFITNKSRFKSSFIVGGSYLFLQSATLIDFTNNISRDNRDSFNRNIFSLNAGLGLHYDLSKRWRVNLEYIFEYHPTPFTRSQEYSPYNSSLSFGIEYRFFWK